MLKAQKSLEDKKAEDQRESGLMGIKRDLMSETWVMTTEVIERIDGELKLLAGSDKEVSQ